MDIEGSEYEVLPSLLRSRAVTLVDELLLEVHYSRNSWKDKDRGAYCSAKRTAETEPGAACIHRSEAVRCSITPTCALTNPNPDPKVALTRSNPNPHPNPNPNLANPHQVRWIT
eukprot:scaffold94332_cov75-Phaeocystis_antarctica.AAC.2